METTIVGLCRVLGFGFTVHTLTRNRKAPYMHLPVRIMPRIPSVGLWKSGSSSALTQAPHPKPKPLNPKPYTLNPKPLNLLMPKPPRTLNP